MVNNTKNMEIDSSYQPR